jgi:hypothetical protein
MKGGDFMSEPWAKQERPSIMDIGGGGLLEEINFQAKQVAGNLLDPNTPAKAPRKLQIELVFKQDEKRQVVSVSCKVKAVLAPSRPLEANMAFGTGPGGAMQAVELVDNPGQVDIFGAVQPLGKVIDLERAVNGN